MREVQAIIFDLDDTLWEVGPVIVRAEHAMREFLAEHGEISFRDAVGPNATIVDLLSTLLALLELAKRGLLRVAQDQPFAPMVIRRDAPGPTD